ncbi:GNAT family N-acetyltransferase [Solibacillus sp. MA9]|uniref:GNAT family N-acetyltransferase n=1 Tax=Solibacillus palustris TaxID=2908203 RepID=A0ABS9UI64_9BACL|nr:GNAT family N-acetyltransferase [Solibacillus sp. MA9]MCH7324032.1 GNAT family N-acetyltransferase [Solibacillus sp. MA9]
MRFLLFEQLIPINYLASFQEVHKAVFESDEFKFEKLQHKQNLLAILAMDGSRVAGFKLGYEHPDGVFYSWLGGVHPNYQKQGIAATCMEMQHSWCKQQGYTRVRTYGRNEKKAMLIVNIKAGFDIVKTFVDDKGRQKIVFEKEL